ncbi:hypothetical protein LG326_04395 [Metaplanococcus flavidus]
MKKLYLMIFILIIGSVLMACSEETETAETEEAAIIQVTNSSARQITSIELKLYQNDMVQASPTAMNADESLIVMGETLDFEILTQDINFDEPVIIEAIAMIDGVEESAGKTAPMELRPGENYRFELARDPEMQFREVQEN